jgi:DNA-binding transcriptional ArsR family regulator
MQHKTDNVIDIKRLSEDVEYYNNVFKKIEKIVSVVFYILSFTDKKDRNDNLSQTLQAVSFKVHELSLETLQSLPDSVTDKLLQVRHQLLALDSTVRLAEAARMIAPDLAQLVTEQVDGVQRYLSNHYLQHTGLSIKDLHSVAVTTEPSLGGPAKKPTVPKRRGQQRVQVPAGDISSDAYMVYSQLTDRAERIKTVLEAKPQATIKDVAEIITDVSEKTIQRELNSLIEKGQVIREGERRWSRYSVVKD